MKKAKIVFVLLGMILIWQPAYTQQDEVEAAMVESLAAWRAGDFATLGNYYAVETRGFMLDEGYLLTGYNPAALEAAMAAGFAFEVEARDIDIILVNETVAVAVAYVDGSVTVPGGTSQEGTWRYSETRVKRDGYWKVVQYHFSKLVVPEIGDIP